MRHPTHPCPTAGQRGAAALVITVVLFFTLLLAAVYVNRSLVFEQRSSANQYRSTQAFEAAEAGLEWAAAALNGQPRIGADCQSQPGAATSFRERYTARDPLTGRLSGRNTSAAQPLQAACVRAGTGWSCSCPSDGATALAAPSGDSPAPAFILKFLAGDRPGVLRVASTGCTSAVGACAGGAAGAADGADATATVEVSFGLLPALATLPIAPLTLRGGIDAGSAALGLHNADPASGGVTLHAGASVAAPLTRLSSAAGSSAADAAVEADATLAALTPERLFSSHFGIDKLGWKGLPVVRRVSCGTDCAGVLTAALEGSAHSMLWVGPAAGAAAVRIDGPLTLGTPAKPVVLVIDGPLQLSGVVRIHGLVYAASLAWTDASTPGALLRGAAILEGDYAGDAAADLVYDAALLTTLRASTGSLVRINGSWRDY